MKVCSKAPLSKNLHHVEANQLTFIECQMSGLYMTQDITKRSFRTDLQTLPAYMSNNWFNCYEEKSQSCYLLQQSLTIQ